MAVVFQWRDAVSGKLKVVLFMSSSLVLFFESCYSWKGGGIYLR